MRMTITKYPKRLILFLLIFIFADVKINAQASINSLSLCPGVNIGYNLGSGLDFGAHLGLTFFNYTLSGTESGAGIDISYDYFFGHTYLRGKNRATFKSIGISLLNSANNQVVAKLGIAKTAVRWGFDNRNKSESKSWGYNADISYAPLKNGFFIGYHLFQVNNACMGLGVKHSNIVYAAYRYPVNLLLNEQVSIGFPNKYN
jgi:hypothetical protein